MTVHTRLPDGEMTVGFEKEMNKQLKDGRKPPEKVETDPGSYMLNLGSGAVSLCYHYTPVLQHCLSGVNASRPQSWHHKFGRADQKRYNKTIIALSNIN